MQSCFTCCKLSIDKEALKNNTCIDKCNEFGFHVIHPIINGWKCPRYEGNNSWVEKKSIQNRLKKLLIFCKSLKKKKNCN